MVPTDGSRSSSLRKEDRWHGNPSEQDFGHFTETRIREASLCD